MKEHIVRCTCEHPEHTAMLRYDKGLFHVYKDIYEPELYVEVLLGFDRFFYRLKSGLRYIIRGFGQYGAFSEICVDPDSAKEMVGFLQEFIDDAEKGRVK